MRQANLGYQDHLFYRSLQWVPFGVGGGQCALRWMGLLVSVRAGLWQGSSLRGEGGLPFCVGTEAPAHLLAQKRAVPVPAEELGPCLSRR